MNASTDLPFDRDEMRLLAEVGFLAAANAQLPAARRIFTALRLLRPDSVLPFIGLAVVSSHEGRPEEAVRLLAEDALRQIPRDEELRAFLGLSLVEAGRFAEAGKVLRELAPPPGSAEPHLRLAAGLLRNLEGARPPSVPRPSMPRLAIPAAEGVRHAH